MPHLGEVLGLAIASAPSAGGGGGASTVIKGSAVVTVPAWSLDARADISVPGVSSAMVALLTIARHNDDDENSEELLDVGTLSASAGIGSISVYLGFTSPTSGPVRVNYMVS